MSHPCLDPASDSLAIPLVGAGVVHFAGLIALLLLSGATVDTTPITDPASAQPSPTVFAPMQRVAVVVPTRAGHAPRGHPPAPQHQGSAPSREQLVSDLLARQGAIESLAASPDPVAEPAVAASTFAAGDPERAEYEARIQAVFRQHFRPLPHLTGISCVLALRTDAATGRIVAATLAESSGNASYDAACERAAWSVQALPTPPAHLASLYANGYRIRLRPQAGRR